MSFRAKATAIHLLGSAAVAAAAAALVYGLWYPAALAALAGGTALFKLVVGVDMVLGPALTAVVANPRKPKSELWRDIALILAVQTAALGYGLWAVASARPAGIVFEVDMFRLVAANEIDRPALSEAPAELRSVSWTGPLTWAAIKPESQEEQLRTIDLGLAGVHLAHLPAYWRPYDDQADMAWQLASPIQPLLAAHPNRRASVESAAQKAGVNASELKALPLLSRHAEGTVLLAPPDARIVGILPLALVP